MAIIVRVIIICLLFACSSAMKMPPHPPHHPPTTPAPPSSSSSSSEEIGAIFPRHEWEYPYDNPLSGHPLQDVPIIGSLARLARYYLTVEHMKKMDKLQEDYEKRHHLKHRPD